MNVCQACAMLMPVVMTPKGLLLVNAILGFQEMGPIVLVSTCSINLFKAFYNSCSLLIFSYFYRH